MPSPRGSRRATSSKGGFSPRLSLQRMSASVRTSAGFRASRPSRVTREVLEALVRQEPALQRGIYKHSGDLVKHGFRIIDPKTGDDHRLNDDLQKWLRQHDAMTKIGDGIVGAHIYGDGLWEYEWEGEAAVSTEPPASDAPALEEFHVIDPSPCWFTPLKDGSREAFYLTQRLPAGGDTVSLHPTRYDHARLKVMPGYIHGLSTAEAAFHAAISMVKGYQGLGEILYHAGAPLRFGAIERAQDDEVAAVFEMMNDPAFQRAVVWDDRLKLTQLNPQGVDPLPYFTVMEVAVAEALGMPVALIKGVQAGAVTGSETNLVDYHSDLTQIQETRLTPVAKRLSVGALTAIGHSGEDFAIAWNPFPQDSGADAAATRERVTAWSLLVSQGIDPLAAARICKLPLKKGDVVGPQTAPNEAQEKGAGKSGENSDEDAPAGQEDEAGGD